MKKEQERMNKMWWMASAVVLLFVALAVVPVAAEENPWQGDHGYTNVSSANDVAFDFYNDGKIHFTMTNATGGQNAIHMSDSNSAHSTFQCTETGNMNDQIYVTNTGGRTYQDDIRLLVGVASYNTDTSDKMGERQDIWIDINASGYSWEPNATQDTGPVLSEIQWGWTNFTLKPSYYLTNPDNSPVYQTWKFGPYPFYRNYCGQDPLDNETSSNVFNFTAMDLKMGVLSDTSLGTLNDKGMVNISYRVYRPDGLSQENNKNNTNIDFNVYAYNRNTAQGLNQTLWLNNITSDSKTDPKLSGWLYSYINE